MSREGCALFFTGLPASGKTTLAGRVAERLTERGVDVRILDSDALRSVLTPNATYSAEERAWFYRVVGYIAGMLTEHGVVVLIAASAPLPEHRRATRDRAACFEEVFVDCPEEVCRARDPKGLWAKSDAGQVDTLPGVGVPYHPPQVPLVSVDTDALDPEQASQRVLETLDRTDILEP